MKKNGLDIIGYVDNRLVEKAEKYRSAKKKHTWVKWGTLAACLCLCLVGAFTIFPHFANQKVDTPAPDDSYESVSVIPMVFVNDKLYVQAYDGTIIAEKQDNFMDLGEITSNVLNVAPDSDGIPKVNLQTNQALVGCDVYQNGDDIVVYVENTGYLVFVEYGGPDTDMWNEALK